MKVLITDTNSQISNHLKDGLTDHNVEISKNLKIDFISKFDCVLIQSLSENCHTPEDLNKKVQETYNILSSCIESGTNKVIMISTLSLMKEHNDNYTVTEKWKTTPSTQMDSLSSNLCEIIFKEFGRTFSFQKILLRIGFPIADRADITEKYSSAISISELVTSLNKIINTNFKEKYEIIHIQNTGDNQRFLTSKFNELNFLAGDQDQAFYTPIERKS